MSRVSLRALALVFAASAATLSFADSIELKDGRKFSGRAVTEGTRVLITTDDGATLETTTDNIRTIKQVGSLSKDDVAASDWRRAAAAARNAADLNTAIGIVDRFLKQYPESASTTAAQSTLAGYKKLGDAGAVKFRGDWISTADFDAIKKSWTTAAEPAALFYKAGQLKESLNAVNVILTKDPQNPDALAVAGLASFRANNLGLAQRYFALLSETTPASGMGYHNLAVLYNLRKDTPNVFRNYAKALQALPNNRLVIDNVAEALHAFKDDKILPHYKALNALYEQAEAKMEAQMLKDKTYRWGSTWVSEEQLGKLNTALEDIKTQMRELDVKYRGNRTLLPNVEEQITHAQDDVNNYQAQATALSLPTLQTAGRPGTYVDPRNNASAAAERTRVLDALDHAKSRLEQLQQKRAELLAGVQEMQARAANLKNQLASVEPQFTGIHRIMDLGEDQVPPPYPAVNIKYEPLLGK